RSASAWAAAEKSGSRVRSTIAALAMRCNRIRGGGTFISRLLLCNDRPRQIRRARDLRNLRRSRVQKNLPDTPGAGAHESAERAGGGRVQEQLDHRTAGGARPQEPRGARR